MYKMLGLTIIAAGMAAATLQATVKNRPAPATASPAQTAAMMRQQPGPQAVSLSANASGHFVADARINGIFIKGIVDTGATTVALPVETARQIGIEPRAADYTIQISTANGITHGAPVRLNEVRISGIVVRDVEAVVVEEGLSVTLIGMSFIRRISSELRGNTLTLRQ